MTIVTTGGDGYNYYLITPGSQVKNPIISLESST